MKHPVLNATFQLTELAIRVGMLLLIYQALGLTAEKTITDEPDRALFHMVVLFGIAALTTWKSKELASQLVDIVRKPIYEQSK